MDRGTRHIPEHELDYRVWRLPNGDYVMRRALGAGFLVRPPDESAYIWRAHPTIEAAVDYWLAQARPEQPAFEFGSVAPHAGARIETATERRR